MSEAQLNAVLCYVDGPRAFFTTKKLEDQWGDDWNDAPYEHNAEPPYGPYGDEIGTYEIVNVYWEGPYETPADRANGNSQYSVQDINGGAVAWLSRERYTDKPVKPIPAGTTLRDFIQIIQEAGGSVFTKTEPSTPPTESKDSTEARG